MRRIHQFDGGAEASRPRADYQEIRRALALLLAPGSVAELRVLNTQRGVASGYFDDFTKLAEAAAAWSGQAPAVYITANPVNPTLLARAVNRVELYAKHTTGDGDIALRRWLLLDFDAVRPAGVSATEAEHQAALDRARACVEWLFALGFTADMLLVADSGNGGHVVVRLDLPNDASSRVLVERCLAALAFRFTDDVVKVDVTVGNAARIWKVYGTLAAKGDSTPERPHRLARILEAPEHLAVAPQALLERLAALAPQAEQKTSFNRTRAAAFDLDAWMAAHADVLHVERQGPWNGGQKYILNPCPWNPAHTNGATYILRFPSGPIAAGCHHNGCAGRDWHALRDLVEPGWRNRQRAREASGAEHTPEEDEADERQTASGCFTADGKFVPAKAAEHLKTESEILLGHDRRLWRYARGVYRPDGDDWARQRTRELVGYSFRRNHLEEVTAFLRAQLPSLGHEPPRKFINCANGLLDWKTGTLQPHTPEVLSTNQIPVAWNPAATAPTVTRFLGEVLPTDSIGLVEELIGYALYPGNPFRKAVMLLGPGGNGKSVLLRLITDVLGKENVASVPLQALGEDRFAAANLFGKLANICGDLDARAIERTDLFKQVTGGDPIRGQHKFRDAFDFTCYATPLFSANEPPRTADQTDAWFDRWIILPMFVRFEGTERADPELSDKLAAEVEGVLVRSITGLRRLMARGRFVFPPSVEQAHARYRRTLDSVQAFLLEEYHFDPTGWADRADLYRHYKDWCREGGRFFLAATTFNERLRQDFGGTIVLRKRMGRPGWLGLAKEAAEFGGDVGDEGDEFSTLTYRHAPAREDVGKGGNGIPIVPSVPSASTGNGHAEREPGEDDVEPITVASVLDLFPGAPVVEDTGEPLIPAREVFPRRTTK